MPIFPATLSLVKTGAKNLFLHMILPNAGVCRRQAIETVVTSGWSEPVAEALGRLLRNENEESWVRVRALFALGFLQRPDDYFVEEALVNVCVHAHANLTRTPVACAGPCGWPRTSL